MSFPTPEGIQPQVLGDPLYGSSAGVPIHFPSPVPPEEEPPYVPGEHGEGKGKEEDKAGDSSTVTINVASLLEGTAGAMVSDCLSALAAGAEIPEREHSTQKSAEPSAVLPPKAEKGTTERYD